MKLGIAALALALSAGMAHSATTGFSLTIENESQPRIDLVNIGDTGQITGLQITIGDLSNNFDGVFSQGISSGPLGFTLVDPDTVTNGALRSDFVTYSFTGFDSGDGFFFSVDPDQDSLDSFVDLVTGVLNGGSATVTFSGGLADFLTIDLTPGAGSPDDFIYTAIAPVPLPASLPLVLVGLGALGVMRKRRRA